jgi:hypothetical protein
VRPETTDRVIRAMSPATSRLDAEPDLLAALREHRACPLDDHAYCPLLDAAGAFYMSMVFHARGHALERLMDTWIEVVRAYDRAEDLDGPVHKMYETAFTYRLLLS